MRLRMAVIGVGHLGKEHARILAGMPEVELVGVADVNADQATAVARRCCTQAYTEYWPLLNLVDALVLAVPTVHHHPLAIEFLRRGIPVLIEKPIAVSLSEAEELVATARRTGAVLQVGHIERFNPAFEELQQHPLQPKFVECERLGAFSGRSTDIGAVLDLMIHDLDLLLALVQSPVSSVEAVGVALFGEHEDVANARLGFANGCVATVTASRASAAPVRRMRVWAPEGYAGVDFARRHLTLVQPSEQFRASRVSAEAGNRRSGLAERTTLRPLSRGPRNGLQRRRSADAGTAGLRPLRANASTPSDGRRRGMRRPGFGRTHPGPNRYASMGRPSRRSNRPPAFARAARTPLPPCHRRSRLTL